MTVINVIELTRQSLLPFIIAAGLLLSLFISVPLMNKIKNGIISAVFGVYSLLAVSVMCVMIIACGEFQEPSGKYHYEIIIDNDTSFAEVIEKYKIIEQRGEIFVVEEKENESTKD